MPFVLFQGANYILEFDNFPDRDVCRDFVGELQSQLSMSKGLTLNFSVKEYGIQACLFFSILSS